MSTGGLLAVHAHPDDETLSTGALLATFAAAGRPVTLVTCTRGERGEVIPPELGRLEGDGPALALVREGEIAAAAQALGVDAQVFLDRVPLAGEIGEVGAADEVGERARYEDSGMAWLAPGRAGSAGTVPEHAFVAVDLDEAAARLASVIADRRPDVVAGYEPGGGYGHPDHVRAHQVLMRAVELVDHDPVVLWAVLDPAALRDAYATLPDAPAGMVNPSATAPLPSAASGTRIDLRVDVVPVAARVRTALAAHRTQVALVPSPWGTGPVVGTYALSNGVVQPVLRRECYRFAPGHEDRGALVDWPTGIER